MAAITKRLLNLRPYPCPLRQFSSSSDPDDQSQTPPSASTMSKPPSKIATLLALYEKNIKSKGENSGDPSSISAGDGNHSLESIRPSFGRKPFNSSAISNFTKGLRVKASLDGRGKGMGFGKIHDRSELGKRLQAMRPGKQKGKWFSLQEMSERLAKDREAQHEEMGNRTGLPHVVADGLFKIHKDSLQKEKQKGPLGGHLRAIFGIADVDLVDVPPKRGVFRVLNSPPLLFSSSKRACLKLKERTQSLGSLFLPVKPFKYFHPDNMSSAEKLKLEIEKVKDEFKMSESDCGSARVQVAQLTTQIKHLSTVLHKKDKHSTRGLLALVQRRKKLLKYLRRTDWDSYCLVLSKLGLRDNPDVKA
ncbi:hypothetical protein SASPL_128761 [Salvia splendens]|uniref:Small ribosomal subunit protein uS15c n=1 Tax=Salvia splendens TaxID=180675 RepID=A0A8X8ZN33_SALSN|nr:hypothetical protein SASPL_128761 [Salvia splendens]